VTDPTNEVPRTHVVTVRGELADAVRARLDAGIEIGGERRGPQPGSRGGALCPHAHSVEVRKRSRRADFADARRAWVVCG
jgi:hypothetical protein